jgi:hypothetical protein
MRTHGQFLVLLLFVSACQAPKVNRFSTPVSTDPPLTNPYPYEAQYEILGIGTGQACGDLRDLQVASMTGGKSDSPGAGSSLLYQQAKYLAIEQIPNADNLLFVRVKAENDGWKQCVTVTGRGYRLTSVHSRPAVAEDDDEVNTEETGAGSLWSPPPPAPTPAPAPAPTKPTPVKP